MSNLKAVECKKFLTEAKQRKLKLKKNAMEPVDIDYEKKIDPKFKTEMCKSWVDSGFCVYGNKCRFAHGREEIFERQIINSKYKQKNCQSFHTLGYCNYGVRCHFKHNERKLDQIETPHYLFKLLTSNFTNLFSKDQYKLKNQNVVPISRLNAFVRITEKEEVKVESDSKIRKVFPKNAEIPMSINSRILSQMY